MKPALKKIALIIEGKGDVQAAPSLVSKIGAHFDTPVLISIPPIRAGEAKKLARIGELERHLILASSRVDADEILILVDLDDGCAVKFAQDFRDRANAIQGKINKSVHICFCVREYECWFLDCIESLRIKLPDFGIDPTANFPNASQIRGAKEALKKVCKQRIYRESRDQLIFTKSLDLNVLVSRNRSFRKLFKSITGFDYKKMTELAENKMK